MGAFDFISTTVLKMDSVSSLHQRFSWPELGRLPHGKSRKTKPGQFRFLRQLVGKNQQRKKHWKDNLKFVDK